MLTMPQQLKIPGYFLNVPAYFTDLLLSTYEKHTGHYYI